MASFNGSRLSFILLTQGTQFIGLSLLPAVTVSLLLNFTPIIVAVMGIFILSERPSMLQWMGTSLFIVGILTYFYPVDLSESKTLGIIVMTIEFSSTHFLPYWGGINRSGKFHPLTVTVVSMGIGSIIMLIIGLAAQGLPHLSLTNILFLLLAFSCKYCFCLYALEFIFENTHRYGIQYNKRYNVNPNCFSCMDLYW